MLCLVLFTLLVFVIENGPAGDEVLTLKLVLALVVSTISPRAGFDCTSAKVMVLWPC